ncbi:MAG: ABC transporter permease [Treponemataceae bacterium]
MFERNPLTASLEALGERKWLWSYIGAVAVYLVISVVSGNPMGTLAASITFASFFILVGIGQMLVITNGAGNIDLSVPCTLAMAGSVAMKIMNESNGNIWIGVIAGLAAGAAVGAFNFGLIRIMLMPPMIATMASSFIVKTLSIVFFRGLQIKPPAGLERFVNFKIGMVPIIFLFVLGIAFVMHFVLNRTPYGRYIHAIGQNIKAAWLSGINVTSNKLITYILSGVFASLTGILLAAFSGGATLDMGDEYMMNSIAVVVLGGSSIAGGNSNIPGIVGASVLLYLIVNLLNILGLGASLRSIFTGIVIVAIIFASGEKLRKR